MRNTVYKRRQFLNTEENGGNAFINCSVSEADENSIDADITLSDCSRQITLDFSIYGHRENGVNAADAANLRQKISKLRKTIVAFEAALLAQLDNVDVE